MEKLDPNQFIITRKRKKYKFALFNNSPICFEFAQWQKRQVDVVEVGSGNGLFSVELAARSPEKTFVAIDVKGDRLQKGAAKAESLGLKNIFFVRARADQLNELFEPDSLEKIWITFPDPFPKKRSAGRRLTHNNFLKIYKQLLAPGGHLLLKHDDRDFFCWSLEQLVASNWQIENLSFDLHEAEGLDEAKITTTYEQRWMGEGKQINFVSATPRA
ncbi:tRNA (guanosine(46)-N7)-methyltransferase TrmB [Candidatus Saccharibacteria bacterium]|nr:MAG: tRNA (guanosine(46)-N7)-methyltransferase TrmB [Candidatus Saccharibacteria bacterium]